MNYLNAKEVLPPELFKEIQKYAGGNLLYVPLAEEKEKTWGEVSGQKQYYRKRNRMIQNKFLYGVSVSELAKEYTLSKETVKKIVYEKQGREELRFSPGIQSAKEYNDNNLLEEWIHTYLLSDGHNKEFSDGLKLFDRYFLGPVKMPLSLFKRCCGPEEDMKWVIPKANFEDKVNQLMQVITENEDMPPLIVSYVDGHFELNDGNHRFEAYQRLGIEEYYVIVWITEKEDYAEFMDKYSGYME